jgi:hypothetical protein
MQVEGKKLPIVTSSLDVFGKTYRYIFGRGTSIGDNTTTWKTQPTSHLLMCRYLNGVLCLIVLWSIVGQETTCMGMICRMIYKSKTHITKSFQGYIIRYLLKTKSTSLKNVHYYFILSEIGILLLESV